MDLKSIIYGVVALIIIYLLFYGYHLYKENQILTLNNAKLETSIQEQKEVIEQQKKDIASKDKIQKEYVSLVKDLEIQKTDLLDKFNKEKTITVIIDEKSVKVKKQRDIGKLAKSKPKMVQTAVNKGTIKEFRCIEYITNPNFKDFNNTKGVLECK